MPDKTPAKASPRTSKNSGRTAGSTPAAPAPTPLLPLEPPAPPPEIVLRNPAVKVPVRHLDAVQPVSTYWTHVLANRARFTDDSRATLQERAKEDLRTLGAEDFTTLMPAQTLEVSIPFEKEDRLWAARVCPWEGLLRFATRGLRQPDQPLVVVRELRRTTPAPAAPRTSPSAGTLLLVVSAPGRVGDVFDFTLEERVVTSALRLTSDDPRFLKLRNPTLEELAAAVQSFRPEVIHLAGVDAHQGAALLQQPQDPQRHDGYLLRGPGDKPWSVEAEPLANALTAAGTHAPGLVCFNFYNSGSRLAALAIAKGAKSAVGFQDTIDDRTAEQFFGNLYTLWHEMGRSRLLESFILAQQQAATSVNARNNGDIVLWNESSVFQPAPQPEVGLSELTHAFNEARRASMPWLRAVRNLLGRSGETSAAASSAPPPDSSASPPDSTGQSPSPVPASADTRSDTLAGTGHPRDPRLKFEIKPLPDLNYSLLHNRSAIFGSFQVDVDDADLPLDIEVRVQLFSGEDSFVARSQHKLTSSLNHLHELIHIPLTASIMRSRREGIGTTLTAEVFRGDKQVHVKTSAVRLLPADEWVDTPEDRCWLPSFVLPRDPAIQRIVGSAKNYLKALTDNSGAGFDGYQRIVDEVDTTGCVELQARALWSALLYEHPLSYINPPPTYTINSQRIRTPSQIMEEGLATCIDLALLYCASLEYLGVMPVMFLIHGHAFPGYWRTPQAYDKFWKFGNVDPQAQSPRVPVGRDGKQRKLKPWEVEADGFSELMRAIESGGLVPLETTAITRKEPFHVAQEAGVKNLLTPWGFDTMIDVTRARGHNVTPLPLIHQHS